MILELETDLHCDLIRDRKRCRAPAWFRTLDGLLLCQGCRVILRAEPRRLRIAPIWGVDSQRALPKNLNARLLGYMRWDERSQVACRS